MSSHRGGPSGKGLTEAACLCDGLQARRINCRRCGESVTAALQEVRDIARGIHPAVLSHGGLAPALQALARRSAVPVTLAVSACRRPAEHIEVTAYYVVSELLTNAAKHARAGSTPDFGTASRRCARGVPECAPPCARG